jgi:hypothetical protein
VIAANLSGSSGSNHPHFSKAAGVSSQSIRFIFRKIRLLFLLLMPGFF